MRNFWEPRLQYTLAAIGIIGGVASTGYSIYKGIKAGQEEKKATAEGASLRRPFEKIADEYYENKNAAEMLATGGLSVDEKGYMQEQREKQFGTSADALARTGASPNEYARINQIFGESLKSQAAIDAQQHVANIQYLQGVNKEMAGQKTTAWGVNEYQPFESKLKEIQDRKIAAITNKNNAIQEGIGSLSALTTSINSAVGGGGGKPPKTPPSSGGGDEVS